MEQRLKKILAAIVEEYTATAIPVGSKILKEKYGFKISSATIRNDMAELEEKSLLYQPHISAGRIPTDKGYRFFVEKIMRDKKLSPAEQKKLQTEILKLKAQNQRLSRMTARLLSSLSGSLAISQVDKEFCDFGMKELLEKPEFKKIDNFCQIAEALDCLEENIAAILKRVKMGETKIFIGRENPIKGISSCSMMVSPYETKSGEKAVLAIIGPKRMPYEKNKSLMEFFKKFLGQKEAILAVIFINLPILI